MGDAAGCDHAVAATRVITNAAVAARPAELISVFPFRLVQWISMPVLVTPPPGGAPVGTTGGSQVGVGDRRTAAVPRLGAGARTT